MIHHNINNSQNVNNQEAVSDNLFAVTQHKHWQWALSQSPTVYRLWGQCWMSDSFGDRYSELQTDLKGDNLRKAKKVISDAGLFSFVPIHDTSKHQKVIGWKVRNHFGKKVNNYKETPKKITKTIDKTLPTDNLGVRIENRKTQIENLEVRIVNPDLIAENLATQGTQNPSGSNSGIIQEKEINNSNTLDPEIINNKHIYNTEPSSELTDDENTLATLDATQANPEEKTRKEEVSQQGDKGLTDCEELIAKWTSPNGQAFEMKPEDYARLITRIEQANYELGELTAEEVRTLFSEVLEGSKVKYKGAIYLIKNRKLIQISSLTA